MNDFQYGELDDVADLLNTLPRELTDAEIKGVLINLCQRVHASERSSKRAANIASCLANGIQPD